MPHNILRSTWASEDLGVCGVLNAKGWQQRVENPEGVKCHKSTSLGVFEQACVHMTCVLQ